MSRCLRAVPAVAALTLAVTVPVACSSSGGSPGGHARKPPAPLTSREKKAQASGCGGTRVRTRNAPSWATGGFTGTSTTPYAISARGTVVAYLFGFPLKAPKPKPPDTDKVLWFVQGRTRPLHLEAHRVGGSGTVSKTLGTRGSGSLPSYVTVPAPGCWHFDLTWNGTHHDTLNIRYYTR